MSDAEPMTTTERRQRYDNQNGRRQLTVRQNRQLRRMLNREVSRGLGQLAWTRPPARKPL